MKPSNDEHAAESNPPRAELNLMDTAHASSRLQQFEKASRLAGLTRLLSGRGPFTVFAPTDKAFAQLSDVQRDALFADVKALARVLSYHVVRARVKAPRTGATHRVTTVQGEEIAITRDAGGYRVNAARIVKTQIRASNGVIHAIDTLLQPT